MKKNIALIASITVTIVCGFVLSSSQVGADSVTDLVSITVPTSCTITVSGSGIYSATVYPGNNVELIGNPINVVCNDNGGYDLYAIGYSGDSYETNNTDLQTSMGLAYYIHTATSGIDSYWAMKIVSSGSDAPMINNSFNEYQEVPSTYTKIAHFEGVATDSITTPTYKISVDTTQVAGDYNGKVKYTVVHPNNAEPPSSIVMQDLIPSRCTSVPTKVVDVRDDKEYHVQRLADGKCWMLENLALDLTDLEVQEKLTQNTTNASVLSLEYLKGERAGATDDQYATTAVSTVWNNKNNLEITNSYSYSDPRIYIRSSTDTSGGNDWEYGVYYNYCAATAGSYCYGDGSIVGATVSNASEDICPSGWRLPTGGTNSEYSALVAADVDVVTSMRLPFSGIIVEGSPSLQGSNGSWWTSTRDNNSRMKRLYIGSWEIYSNSFDNRSNGSSIRCVLDD